MYATLRILPSVSKIIQSMQSIKFNNAVIDIIYNQLINIKNKDDNVSYNFTKKLDFDSINFNNLKFWYQDEKKITLDDININISKGSKIGIVGKSGSGKSTFINLFCGLLKPKRGNIFIDNVNLINVCKEFQEGMAYVPQKVTIFDESILFNITLELDEDLIDFSKLNKILKVTEMYDFVYSLSNNIKENVGEKGSKLSGGQCQRIGIARVLYKEKDIIIFDEATSALDENTEIKIFDKIFEIYKEKTILISSHRRSLLNYCDMIYEIKDKKINKILNENDIEILDCTFRDGGYYNNWNFNNNIIQDYIDDLNKLNIKFIEIGFRTFEDTTSKGETGYSRDRFINKLKVPKDIFLGVMINASDLISKNNDPLEKCKEMFDNKVNSKIKFIRFACHFHEIFYLKKNY